MCQSCLWSERRKTVSRVCLSRLGVREGVCMSLPYSSSRVYVYVFKFSVTFDRTSFHLTLHPTPAHLNLPFSPVQVGKLFSIQASLETLSKLVGSSLFTGIYAATVHVLPAAAYLSETAVYVGVLALLLWLGQLMKEDGVQGLLWTFSRPYAALARGPGEGEGQEEGAGLASPSKRKGQGDEYRKPSKPRFPLGAGTP